MAVPATRNETAPRLAAATLRVRLQAFCAALEHATGLSVGAQTHRDYGALLQAVLARKVDLFWLPPLMAVRAFDERVGTPLLVPVREGSSAFWSVLFCRRDSPIRSIDDLSGKRIAWVDPQSASGYTVMRAWLVARGIDVDRTFSRAGFVGSHDAVVGTVLGGKADVGATYAHVDEHGKVITASWHDAPVRVLGMAGPIPSDVLAAGAALSEETMQVLRGALTGTVDTELRAAALTLFEADRFEPATAADLGPWRKLNSV